jgi:hypothetical protein
MENEGIVLDQWPGVDFSDMVTPKQNSEGKSSIEGRLSTLEERSVWHRNIGWGVAGLLGAALLGLVTWWIPRESNSLRESIKSDTTNQLEPIKLDLARINALLQLKETRSVSEAIRLGVDFSEPKYAMAAVKAIAEQANAENIQTEPSVLIKANEQVKESANKSPESVEQAWSARLSLANYRSSLPLLATTQGISGPVAPFNGTIVDGGSTTGGRQRLDGVYWKNFSFTNVEIEYDGGPMRLENVKFINCTFKMKYSDLSDKFDDALLAQNPVTGSFS